MKNIVYGGCIALAFTAAAGAQDKGMMAANHGDHMAAAQTYSGCVERMQDGMFALTHVTMPKAKGAKAPHAMKSDAMKGDDMAMAKPMMAPETLSLSATSVDLGAHVGQKVSVTGASDDMHGAARFTVASIKTMAKTCR